MNYCLFLTIPVTAAIVMKVLITPLESLNICTQNAWTCWYKASPNYKGQPIFPLGNLSTVKSCPCFVLQFNASKYAFLPPWMVLYFIIRNTWKVMCSSGNTLTWILFLKLWSWGTKLSVKILIPETIFFWKFYYSPENFVPKPNIV